MYDSYAQCYTVDIIFCPPDEQTSGVAGPWAIQVGGQICHPFVLGFGNWRVNVKPRILRIGTRCSCNALFLLHANTYEITI